MQAASIQYKLIKKIRDERFDEDNIHLYHLLINIGTRDFQLCVIDDAKRVLLLEDFVLPSVTSHSELLLVLEQLFDAHALLCAGFWRSIKVSFKNQKFVQVPEALYAEEALGDYLRLNTSVDDTREDFLSVRNPLAEAVSVFAVSKDLKDWLTGLYPNSPPVFVHQSAVLIEGIMRYAESCTDNPLFVYIDRFKLHIVSCDNGKLRYYNQFVIKQFPDYIRYIMLVLKSLNMDQRTSRVVLWGYIGKNSPHYHEFYKYINNVSFGDRPEGLQFSYIFDEVQEHHFFDTFSIHFTGK